jgi:diadenosine tetraphosphate (Ap4A) HIT family hydrolase
MGIPDHDCPFCQLPQERILFENALAFAFRDGYPVSEGHTLVVPRRHVASFFDATEQDQAAMLELLRRARAEIDASLRPAGYNVGINDGAAAGQTVMHVHMHLIPRYAGDRDDPRGGVRWVIPGKADYWSRR